MNRRLKILLTQLTILLFLAPFAVKSQTNPALEQQFLRTLPRLTNTADSLRTLYDLLDVSPVKRKYGVAKKSSRWPTASSATT